MTRERPSGTATVRGLDLRRLRRVHSTRELVAVLRAAGPALVDSTHRDLVLGELNRLDAAVIAADARLSYLTAVAATLRHDRSAAIRHLVRAQAVARPGQRVLAARIAFELGFLYLSVDERATADATLLSAEARDDEARPSADVVHLRALVADAAGDHRAAREAYRSAIRHSARALTPATRVLALTNLAVSLNHLDPRESVSLCHLALATLDAERLHPQIRPSIRNVLGYALACLGDLDAAREIAGAARDDARAMDQRQVALFASFNLAIVDELQGRAADSERRLRVVSSRAAASGLPALEGWTAIRRAWLRLRVGDSAGARALLAERFGTRLPAGHAGHVRMLHALIDLHEHRTAAARRALLALTRSWRDSDDELDRFSALLWLATLDAEVGRDELARRSVNEACAIGRARGFRVATNFWGPQLPTTARTHASADNAGFAAALVVPGARTRASRHPSVLIRGDGSIRVGHRVLPEDAWRRGGTGRRQLRRLFDALRAAYPSEIHRDRLADLLWPESEGDRAVANLYAAVDDLRHVLADVPGVAVRVAERRYGIRLAENARIEPPPDERASSARLRSSWS